MTPHEPKAADVTDVPARVPPHAAAFSVFYRDFVSTLVAFLVWQGARLPDAAEIAQDTMAQLYQRWADIDHPEAWTRTVASRAMARRLANSESHVVDPEGIPHRTALLPHDVDEREWWQRHEVLRALDLLPPRQRQVMAWTLHEYTPTEIAEILRITPGAVRANLMKARGAISRHLAIREEGL
ncbi:sigma-70 family RNA polymerase sigma factor [Nocardia fluminea]|uniref:sigma-70 family RNA polymerase sigma factor n=1 Tax=Nocardia fluminea TaxID=134984 RepID=UPI0036514E79